MSDDPYKSFYHHIKAQEAFITRFRDRIAELEAALRDVLPYVDTCNSSHREAQAKGYAALEGEKQ
jgi:hypothetical protein